jgi:hypothetical protein
MNWKFWKKWFAPRTADETSSNSKETLPANKNDDALNDSTNQGNAAAISETVIPTVYITAILLERTRELLASFAKNSRSEGVVYWFGFELGESAVVTTLIVPDADTSFGCIRTTPRANAQALSAIVGTPLMLLGQAHSHPGKGVRHSETDDQETFASFDGAISVVVPHFGQEGIELETCGIHRHTDGAFQYIESSKISDHISVLPGEADFRNKAAKGKSKNKSVAEI